eukprot:NODE_66_length_23959_cov_0.323009.p13 type:complete len:139 gc:universal NODE_66_length_23959_cov_0.323009:3533-3949(+)
MFIAQVSGLMQYAVGIDCYNFYLWKAFNPTLNCSRAMTWDCKKVENSSNTTQLLCNDTGLTTIFKQDTFTWSHKNVSYAVVADGRCYLDPLTSKGYVSNCTHVEECHLCSSCSVLNTTGSCLSAAQTSGGSSVVWKLF